MRAAAISSGRYDVAPCLAQDVVAVSEEGAQLDGFAGLALLESDREAPGAGRVVAVDVRGRDLGVRPGRDDGLAGGAGGAVTRALTGASAGSLSSAGPSKSTMTCCSSLASVAKLRPLRDCSAQAPG